MDTEFGRDFITITDEDGVEYELEILSTVEYNGALYYALAPADTDEDEELEVSVLKAVEEDGEEILVAIDDDDELEKVYELLIEQMYEEEE
ncbi:MAG: DUF1292 domain-containing protein [Ruminococcaceae bacterium]|nr:DUF1292 domain-containing protein [Oscillospiraceae bacterium]